MDPKDFVQLKKDIAAYKKVKDDTNKKINDIRQDVIDRKRYPWHAEVLIDQLYKDLYDTPERKKFSELAEKTKDDSDFEKHFRSAHFEYFFGIIIDPEKLN